MKKFLAACGWQDDSSITSTFGGLSCWIDHTRTTTRAHEQRLDIPLPRDRETLHPRASKVATCHVAYGDQVWLQGIVRLHP